jgi:hypothetical protein
MNPRFIPTFAHSIQVLRSNGLGRGAGSAREERKLEGRLIGFRLPPEQALAARERTRREWGLP